MQRAAPVANVAPIARVLDNSRHMSGIRTNAAAGMLGVSPNTLRSWERRYGFPRPQRSPGGHRQYALTEIEALKQTLTETQNVSSAVSLACERGEGPASPARLAGAFTGFDEEAANRMLEESLIVRSLERTVGEVLLPALAALPAGPEYEFAWRHATGWMAAMRRLAGPATRREAILLLDGGVPCDLDALHAQALELVLRRAGVRSLTLTPAIEVERLGRALRALRPTAVVLSGGRTSLEDLGRLVYAVRRTVPDITVFDFRGAVPDTGASTVCRLGDAPLPACDLLLGWLERRVSPVLSPYAAPSPVPVPAAAAAAAR